MTLKKKKDEVGLGDWNSPSLWRFEYGDIADGALFFAEDAFGNQFCLHELKVSLFDAETGEIKPLADTLESWAARLLLDYDQMTGYPIMTKWQEEHGPVPLGSRLMPKIPFVLGGKYSLDNLHTLAAVSAMRSRGNLARQIKALPDGSHVTFRLVD